MGTDAHDQPLQDLLDTWPVTAAVAVVTGDGVVATAGDIQAVRPLASVTKPLAALAIMQAVSDGSLSLHAPAVPPGATLAHLLSHASGINFDDDRILARPGTRRIYSNRGIELAGEEFTTVSGQPLSLALSVSVLDPLGMTSTELVGSPAKAGRSSVADLASLVLDLLVPSVLDAALVDQMASVHFPGLDGVVPSYGRQRPNDWGLGFEIRSHKTPHWTAPGNSPQTFGHFGQSGSFIWVDRPNKVACAFLADQNFDQWAIDGWPVLSQQVLDRFSSS